MLRILPLADDLILPQAKQEIYFFNRIGQKQPLMTDRFQPERQKDGRRSISAFPATSLLNRWYCSAIDHELSSRDRSRSR